MDCLINPLNARAGRVINMIKRLLVILNETRNIQDLNGQMSHVFVSFNFGLMMILLIID